MRPILNRDVGPGLPRLSIGLLALPDLAVPQVSFGSSGPQGNCGIRVAMAAIRVAFGAPRSQPPITYLEAGHPGAASVM